MSASALRAKLNLHTPVWLTVGNLIELKGVHFVIAALAQVPEATLMVAGGGPEEQHLRDLAHRAGVDGRVRFLGVVAHAELPAYYSAADVMLLASSREGMPNVVLESLACGTPVVATPFAGVDELVNAPEAGEVAEARTAEAILSAWQRLWARRPERAATRRFAEQLGWEPVVEAQYALYAKVLAPKVRGPRTGESA
jgi:glycosyltransferase involved in cell wall biosynthesis